MDELARVKAALSPKAAAYWRELRAFRRRVDAGELDATLDVERERLADEWYGLTEEERERLRAAMGAETPSPSGEQKKTTR